MVILFMTQTPATIGTFLQRHKLPIGVGTLVAIIVREVRQGQRSPDAPRQARGVVVPSRGQAGANSLHEPDHGVRQQIEGAFQNLADKQRKAIEDRAKADHAFFESLQSLSEDQRRE